MELYPHIKPYLADVEKLMETTLAKEDERVYGMLLPFIRRGGKRIRPALTLLSCASAGGKCSVALRPAAIIELFHNFTLIHDDIEDDSRFRRGEPTLHVTYGVALALNSGDALYTLLWRELCTLDMPPPRLLELQNLYVEAFKRVVDGQGVEISWIRTGKFDVSEKEYLDMIGGKTSALMGLSCEVGAFIASAGTRERVLLRDFGELLGKAFQIQDDVLNVTGNFEKYQKEIGGDISEGKRTLMVVHCLAHAEAGDRKRLVEILSSHTKSDAEIEEAIAILKRSGSVDYARSTAKNLIAKAKKKLAILPDSKDRKALIAIADYVVTRER